MIRVARYVSLLMAICWVQVGWADATPPASPPVAPGASARAGSGSQATGASRDAALWGRLRRIQKNIPTDSRRELPFADLGAKNNRFKVPTLVVRHSDDTGSAFRVVRAVYRLDGRELLTLKGADEAAQSDVKVFQGRMIGGRHKLEVSLRVKGHGYGIFSYMKRYRVTLNTARELEVGSSGQTQVVVRVKERDTQDLKRRFAIDIQVKGGQAHPAKPPRIGAL